MTPDFTSRPVISASCVLWEREEIIESTVAELKWKQRCAGLIASAAVTGAWAMDIQTASLAQTAIISVMKEDARIAREDEEKELMLASLNE